MTAKGEIVTLGATSHGPAWDANTFRAVILEETDTYYRAVSEYRYFATGGAAAKLWKDCGIFPKFAWEVRQ
jgi:hypothetical protein